MGSLLWNYVVLRAFLFLLVLLVFPDEGHRAT